MHSLLFRSQGSWDTTVAAANETFGQIAEKIGLDLDRFDDCRAKHVYLNEVQEDWKEGRRLGGNATPMFVINGRKLLGAQSLDTFVNAIENELRRR